MLATRPIESVSTARSWGTASKVGDRAVQKKDQKTSLERLKWIGTIVYCTVVLCLIISQFSAVNELNMSVENTKLKIEEQLEKNEKMSKKVEELRSPSRIVAKAREMGMISSNPGVVAKVVKE